MKESLLAAGLTAILFVLPCFGEQQISGFRGDGTSRYEQASPPTRWSPDSENILWRVKLERAYSSPVLCGTRIFITAPPADLVCFNSEDGSELWRQRASYETVLGEAEAARIEQTHEMFEAERRAVGEQVKALEAAKPDSPELEALKEKRKEIDDRRRAYEGKYPREKGGGAGNTAATVVCDGERVFALFGTGIVVAFTVEGKKLWSRHLEGPDQGFGLAASPILAGGRLIVHIQKLIALDLKSGETVWQRDVPAKFGTPAVAKLDDAEIVITPSGSIIEAAGGKLLAEKQFQLSHNSPLVHAGVLYAHEGGEVKAFRLPKSLEGPFKMELLWESAGARDQRMATALFHQGLLYAAGRQGILEVIEAETGKSAYKKRSEIGEIFSSPVLAGDYVFYCGREGKTLVLRAGDKYEEVAVNASDRISTLPLFFDGKMVLRTEKELICIGE